MAEPLKATFFALQKRDRAVLLPATIIFLLILTVIIGLFVALNWSTLLHLRDVVEMAKADEQMGEEQAAQFIFGMFGFFGMIFLFMFPLYLAIASYEAACLRWMIRGEAPGLFGLTINNDVWRVWGVYWCWMIAQFAVSMAASILTMPLIFMTMGDIMTDPSPEAMWRWQLAVQLPVSLLQYIPLAFIGVRFAPAAATSVLRNRFAFFDAWKVTDGRFWSLLGSFALLWLIAAVVGAAIFAAALGGVFGDLLPRIFTDWPNVPSEELTRRVFSPMAFTMIGVAYAANAIVVLVYSIMSYGVNARAALAAQEDGKIAPYVET